MNILCWLFGHNLNIVDDIDVDKDGKLFQNDRGHRMCMRCNACNWKEDKYPAPGMWFDKRI